MSNGVFCNLAKVIPCILLNRFYSNTDSSVETTCYVSACCYTHTLALNLYVPEYVAMPVM